MSMPKEPDAKQGEAPGPVAPPWYPLAIALTLVTGGLWAWWAIQSNLAGTLVGALPGIMLISSSFSNLFSGGDARISQFMSAGALLGVLLSVPMFFASGAAAGVTLLVLSAASFTVSGYLAAGEAPVPPDVPAEQMGVRLSTKAAGDEVAMLAVVATTRPQAVGSRARRIAREIDEALEIFEEKGLLEDPESYHQTPPPAGDFSSRDFRHKGWELEHLSFESGYEPWPEEPGRERWLSYENNRTAHAMVLRHPDGEPRPWLICIHGLRTSSPQTSSDLFQPEYFHKKLGLNLLYPVLPLHGPRKPGAISGELLFSGDMVDLLHTGAHAAWDVRRLLGWLRSAEQDAPAIGMLGHSLGGYTAALTASLDDRMDCVVTANPSVDPSHMFWRDGLSVATRYLKTEGVTQKKSDQLLRLVSPLALQPKVPVEGRAILASVADRIIPANEPDSLWHHWGKPRVVWHQGTHFGLLQTPKGQRAVRDALYDSGILSAAGRTG